MYKLTYNICKCESIQCEFMNVSFFNLIIFHYVKYMSIFLGIEIFIFPNMIKCKKKKKPHFCDVA
jgi:hypothetical protein